MKLSEKLKKAREHLEKGQKEMASLVGSGHRSWQGYEQGTSIPGGKVFKSLANLGFNTNWFFSDDNDVPMMLSDESPSTSAPPQNNNTIPTMPGDSLGMAEGMTILGRIYGSGDQVFVRAINANLHAFNEALDNKAQAKQAIDQIQAMETRMIRLEARLTKLETENKQLREVSIENNKLKNTG